jgi:translation initiation factor IF-2
MKDISVEQLANIIGTPVDKIILQMKEAGLGQSSPTDLVTDEDKKVLLGFLKSQQSKVSKTISLKRKASVETTSKTTTIEIKRKKAKPSETDEDSSDSSQRIDFNEIEKKRIEGEEFKKSEEERKKKEAESKVSVKRKTNTSQPVVKRTKPSTGAPKVLERKKHVQKAKSVLSKKEQKELEGEEFLSKQAGKLTEHRFEKPSETVTKLVKIPNAITVSDLAKELTIKSSEVVKKLMDMGVMATVNQTLDQDTAILVTEEMGHKAEPALEELAEDKLDELVSYEGSKEVRNPVISVLGHVDHGKTTLLDSIRNSNVTKQEEGGITQKIGAYQAETKHGTMTFIDTPGHAAFSEVRARGANSTDIVILVVAADDGLQPQTEEAISHANAAEVPIIVAVNKIDLEGSDLERVKNELSSKELVPEDWGGNTQFISVSALKGEGIDALLEAISLEAEVLELKAHHDGPAHGVVLDSSTEKGKGAVATVLVQEGTLKAGDMILVGEQTKKIRSLVDENSKSLDSAGPSIPVLISGLDSPPKAGEDFVVVTSEKMAKEISSERSKKARENKLARQQITNLESLFDSELSKAIKLNLVIKADTHGSLEAILGSLKNFESEEVKLNIVHDSVGGINNNDVNLAITTDASIIGFNVRADNSSKKIAEAESIDISYYGIIYDLLDGIKEIIEGCLEPDIKEEVLGTAEVKDTFRSPKFGLIAGSMVIEGTIRINKFVRVLRDDIVVFEGRLDSLRRFKDEASEVATGTECGIGIDNYSDIKVGDKIEVFDKKEIRRTLD